MTTRPQIWDAFSARWLPRVEATLEELLPPATAEPARLHAAMRHAMFPGGKRLRPLLVLAGAEVSGGDPERALVPAAALECVHTYSLVHDDLPCMDDDALRRGRPTCHVAFDEATAVLAGDALLTLAFTAVAEAGPAAVRALGNAAGSHGMVGGQQLDIDAEGDDARATLARVEAIHDRKTGALIVAALEIGALAAGAPSEALQALREYGRLIGRAFQIADDCLDLTSTKEQLGKTTAKDAASRKLTFPAVLGLQASLSAARSLAQSAAAAAPCACAASTKGSTLDARIALLQDLAFFTVGRQN